MDESKMVFRKFYLKMRLFLYSIRKIVNKIIIGLMFAVIFYLFLNLFVFNRVILAKANSEVNNKNYKSAITYYNIAYFYYSLNHFSDENKEHYIEIPYKKALCFLYLNDKKESTKSMLEGLTLLQVQYGIFSKETAGFIRKYLIPYYLLNNKYKLAVNEFNNLIIIYKNIGYSANDTSDVICLSGDLYYEQKKYDEAMTLYRKAYNNLLKEKNIDFEVFSKIVTRMADYEAENKRVDKAIEIYQEAIGILTAAGKNQNEYKAEILIQLGDLYYEDDKSIKNATECYAQATNIIKTLPLSNELRQNITKYLLILEELYDKNNQPNKADEIEIQIIKKRRFSSLF